MGAVLTLGILQAVEENAKIEESIFGTDELCFTMEWKAEEPLVPRLLYHRCENKTHAHDTGCSTTFYRDAKIVLLNEKGETIRDIFYSESITGASLVLPSFSGDNTWVTLTRWYEHEDFETDYISWNGEWITVQSRSVVNNWDDPDDYSEALIYRDWMVLEQYKMTDTGWEKVPFLGLWDIQAWHEPMTWTSSYEVWLPRTEKEVYLYLPQEVLKDVVVKRHICSPYPQSNTNFWSYDVVYKGQGATLYYFPNHVWFLYSKSGKHIDSHPKKETVNGVRWAYTIENGEASLGSRSYPYKALSHIDDNWVAVPKTLGGCPVTHIKRDAIPSYGINRVIIPSTIKTIEGPIFNAEFVWEDKHYLPKLTERETYKVGKDGCILSDEVEVELPQPSSRIVAELELPDELRELKAEHLRGYETIGVLRLPAGLKEIEAGAFGNIKIHAIRFPPAGTYFAHGDEIAKCRELCILQFEGAPPSHYVFDGLKEKRLVGEYLRDYKDAWLFDCRVFNDPRWLSSVEMKEVAALTPAKVLFEAIKSTPTGENWTEVNQPGWWLCFAEGLCSERIIKAGTELDYFDLRWGCTNVTHNHSYAHTSAWYGGEVTFLDTDGYPIATEKSYSCRGNIGIQLSPDEAFNSGLIGGKNCTDFLPLSIHWDGGCLKSVSVFTTLGDGGKIEGHVVQQTFLRYYDRWIELPSKYPISKFLQLEYGKNAFLYKYDPALDDKYTVYKVLPEEILDKIDKVYDLSPEFYPQWYPRLYWKYKVIADNQEAYLFVLPNKLWFIFSADNFELLYKSEPILQKVNTEKEE